MHSCQYEDEEYEKDVDSEDDYEDKSGDHDKGAAKEEAKVSPMPEPTCI